MDVEPPLLKVLPYRPDRSKTGWMTTASLLVLDLFVLTLQFFWVGCAIAIVLKLTVHAREESASITLIWLTGMGIASFGGSIFLSRLSVRIR